MTEHRKTNTENREFPLLWLLRSLWHFLRESAGENDYERYRDRALARGEAPAEAAEFYVARLEHKYSRPSRCC
ncbi:MAG TPA: CstA-like transporter-associated (seleno)protein [Terriglobia bacterium]|nr:CstA-like transporter-associated (seleno)protein [Terriglobia bacterium]